MPSIASFALAAATVLATIVRADYTISPDSVDKATRDYWCVQEQATCPKICLEYEPGTTLVNTCDPDTLTYGCLCGNNQKPNITEYTLTLPFFVCQEWGNQCEKNCPSTDSACQSSCRQDHPCGAKDPEGPKTATGTASGTATMQPTASATDDGTTIFTGTPGSDSDSDPDSGSGSSSSGSKDTKDKPDSMAAALGVGRTYGLAAVMGGMFTIFAFL